MKYPLAAIPISTRDGTLTKDSKSINTLGGQKRPGLVTVQALPAGAAQGMLVSPTLGALAIVNNNLYSAATGALIAAIPSGVGPYDVTEALPNGTVAFKDAGNIWTLVGSVVTKATRSVLTGVVVQVGSGGADGTYALGIAGPGTGATGTYTITGGVLASIAITAGGDGYTTSPALTFPLGGITGATGTATVNAVPTSMLPGFVYLDSTYYVLTAASVLAGSDLNLPLSWPALNFLSLNADTGNAVAIARQLNYVVGFADTFSEFFYDASNPPPGSPLTVVQNAYSDIGCAAAGSIVEVIGSLFFIGKSATKGRSVYNAVGTQVQVVSDEYVDKILELSTLASVSALSVKVAGRQVYLLTLRDLGVTLALDINAKKWELWSSSTVAAPDPVVANSYAQTYFTCSEYLNGNSMDLFQHESNGKVLQMLTTVYQDDGLPIDVQFVTQQIEGETSDYQRIRAAEVIGDKVNSTGYVRFTNDDYQSWSTYQPVNLLQRRSRTVRQGKTSRRAYQVRHTDNTPLRLRELILELTSAPIAP